MQRIHFKQNGQIEGNNVPCTMCVTACVYLMLPQQRKYETIKPLNQYEKEI